MLDAHRRQDGSRWTGQQLDEATGGVVTRSYVTNLKPNLMQQSWFTHQYRRPEGHLASSSRRIASRPSEEAGAGHTWSAMRMDGAVLRA